MASVQSTVVGNSRIEAVGVVQFEFWNGRAFQMYSEDDQQMLQEALEACPRPSEVSLAGGVYVIKGFEEVEHGKATQVNTTTNYERIARLKPTYQLNEHEQAEVPTGAFHFVFEDEQGEWQPYTQRLQFELCQAARCSPAPAQVFFVARGHSYWLVGLDRLSNGGGELAQRNLKTGKTRRVAMWSGEAPAAAARRAAFGTSGATASSCSLATASSAASSAAPGPISAPRLLGSAARGTSAEAARKPKTAAPEASLVVPFVPGGPAAALAAYWWRSRGSETKRGA